MSRVLAPLGGGGPASQSRGQQGRASSPDPGASLMLAFEGRISGGGGGSSLSSTNRLAPKAATQGKHGKGGYGSRSGAQIRALPARATRAPPLTRHLRCAGMKRRAAPARVLPLAPSPSLPPLDDRSGRRSQLELSSRPADYTVADYSQMFDPAVELASSQSMIFNGLYGMYDDLRDVTNEDTFEALEEVNLGAWLESYHNELVGPPPNAPCRRP